MNSSSSQSHGVRARANQRLTAVSRVAPMRIQRCRGVNGSGERSSDRHHSCSVNGTILAKSRGCMPGKPVRRRWALDLHGIRRIGSKDSGFSYQHSDGRSITDEKALARIRKLRVPPAWREVRIARGETSPLQAVGVDKKGRTQYLYHLRFRAQREEEKFQRVVEFGESLPRLRRQVRSDLNRGQLSRDRVLGAIVRLIDQGFFRVGNDKSARSELTYGLTTIRGRHVKVEGSKLLFDYIGKWKKAQKRRIDDREVAEIVRALKGLNKKELFAFV